MPSPKVFTSTVPPLIVTIPQDLSAVAASVAVDLIVFNKDKSKILLINRADHPYVNKLAFPGGFYLQTDDTVEAAATRELVEETSVDIRITEDNLLKITSNKGRDPRGWVISVAYMVLVDEKCIRPRENSDALYANWVNVDSIKKDNMAFDHFEILQYALNL